MTSCHFTLFIGVNPHLVEFWHDLAFIWHDLGGVWHDLRRIWHDLCRAVEEAGGRFPRRSQVADVEQGDTTRHGISLQAILISQTYYYVKRFFRRCGSGDRKIGS